MNDRSDRILAFVAIALEACSHLANADMSQTPKPPRPASAG
jgi:hypothetical protein